MNKSEQIKGNTPEDAAEKGLDMIKNDIQALPEGIVQDNQAFQNIMNMASEIGLKYLTDKKEIDLINAENARIDIEKKHQNEANRISLEKVGLLAKYVAVLILLGTLITLSVLGISNPTAETLLIVTTGFVLGSNSLGEFVDKFRK